jgi:hypothetical protein
MRRGWWRRNMWGLILVVPLAVGLFALNGSAAYELHFQQTPQRAVPVDGTGQAVLDNYSVRVVEIVPVEKTAELKAILEDQPALPTTVKPWRAIVSFGGPDPSIRGCKVALLDNHGREYGPKPSELDALAGNISCLPDDDEQPSPYLSTFYFLLPTDSRPTALRITWVLLLPRYVQFPIA